MASQGSKNSQGSSGSQDERYKELLNPVRDPVKNFEIDVSDLLQNFLEVVESNSQDPISGSQCEINFAEAALMLQASSSIYGKKVEYLYNLTNQLLQAVHNEKKAASLNKAKDKDMLLTGRQNGDEFQLFDDIKYQGKSNNSIADFKTYHQRCKMSALKLTPLALMPLDEREKGNINIQTTRQEVIGNLRDFQMSVCDLMAMGCAFLPTIVFKPENGEAPLFANSTFLSTGVQDDDRMDMSNARFSGSDVHSQPFPNSFDPSPLNVNGMDIENDDDCSVHDDPIIHDDDNPISDSPAASSITRTSKVDNEDKAESQKIDAPMRRRSERQAKQLAAKKNKLNKDPYAVIPDDIPDRIVPLKEPKAPVKRVTPKSRFQKGKKKTSHEFVNDMMHIRKRTLTFVHGNLCMDSKNLKKLTLEANIDASKAFEFLISVVFRHEKKKSMEKDEPALNAEIPFEIPELSAFKVRPLTEQDAPDNDCGSIGPDFDDGPCASPGLPSTPEDDDEPHTFDSVLRKHVNGYLKGTQKFSTSTELSQRVKEWEEKIKPVIEEENEREVFNIHQYGTRIIDKFSDNNRKQSLPFSTICKGKKQWEVCRYFLASLILANNNNVEISASDTSSGMHEVNLTLLSRKRHQEQLDAFGHNSGEHE